MTSLGKQASGRNSCGICVIHQHFSLHFGYIEIGGHNIIATSANSETFDTGSSPIVLGQVKHT